MGASLTDNSDLSELLQTWRFEPDSDPNLAAQVWQRIAASENRTLTELASGLEGPALSGPNRASHRRHGDHASNQPELRRRGEKPFADGIWSRLDQWAVQLTRPLVAATALAACAMLGFVAAEVRYEVQRHDALDRVAAEYVRSIDPVIMTRSPAAAPRP